jgi:hypothetical protein
VVVRGLESLPAGPVGDRTQPYAATATAWC